MIFLRLPLLGLVGNNGAGKTTLFRLLLDLLQADEGAVFYSFRRTAIDESALTNINPAESEAWKNEVGSYIDDGFLIDFLTPEEYFAFLGKISGMTQAEVDQRLEAFERFAGGEIFGQKKLIRNLSAGNKQKVGIISALPASQAKDGDSRRALQLPRPHESVGAKASHYGLRQGNGCNHHHFQS